MAAFKLQSNVEKFLDFRGHPTEYPFWAHMFRDRLSRENYRPSTATYAFRALVCMLQIPLSAVGGGN